MSKNLWNVNLPSRFWLCQAQISEKVWEEAYRRSLSILDFCEPGTDIESILRLTLGEERYGSRHWQLGFFKKTYYVLKPALPRSLMRRMRQMYNYVNRSNPRILWPVEARYVKFLWEVMRQIMILTGQDEVAIRDLWPRKSKFALVLTHDIETGKGQKFVRPVAELEQKLGFRSSFNFVPERYPVDMQLMAELRERGFEVGVHGLKHDGKLFGSQSDFLQKADRINYYLHAWGAAGFRADLTHRQPAWMQALQMDYDLSFFDTDPYEPLAGGVMSIWPFFIGHFVELPYTLVQDYTLTTILGESSPQIWLDKVDFVERYHGMVLVNSHPDYLIDPKDWKVYSNFLTAMSQRNNHWHALPHEVAAWWRERSASTPGAGLPQADYSRAVLDGENIRIDLQS